MSNAFSTSWKGVVRSAAAAAAAIAFVASPVHAQNQPLTTAASCGLPALTSAPVPQYASFLPVAGASVASTQQSAATANAHVRIDSQSDQQATADRINKMRAVSGRPVSVQNASKGPKEMIYLDKVSPAPAKVSSTLALIEGSEECTELGLVPDPEGSVTCSESLQACWETYVAPCTDAPGPEDAVCHHWECRWW